MAVSWRQVVCVKGVFPVLMGVAGGLGGRAGEGGVKRGGDSRGASGTKTRRAGSGRVNSAGKVRATPVGHAGNGGSDYKCSANFIWWFGASVAVWEGDGRNNCDT